MDNEILSWHTVFGDIYTLICLVKDTEGPCRPDRETYIISLLSGIQTTGEVRWFDISWNGVTR